MTSQLPKMQYVNMGNTGARVSRICLGCMSFGDKRWAPWVLEEEEALPLIKKAYDSGINFFDTGKTEFRVLSINLSARLITLYT